MPNENDLWPTDFLQSGPRLPDQLIEEQAAALARLTAGRLALAVDKVFGKQSDSPLGDLLRVRGDLGAGEVALHAYLVPRSVDYRYKLLTLQYDSLDPYPVRLTEVNGEASDDNATDERNLMRILKEVFEREKTKKVLRGLFSQSR